MAYITYAERMRHSMELAEGRTEGLREAIVMTLNARFGASSETLLPLLQQITKPDTLHALFNRILSVTTLDEARATIEEARGSTA